MEMTAPAAKKPKTSEIGGLEKGAPSHRVVALVPARGGTEGMPNKDRRLVNGVPLLVHSIRSALHSNMISETFVSTDCQEVGKLASEHGASVVTRPAELAADQVTDFEVFEHFLRWLEQHGRSLPDMIVHLRPTSPLRTDGLIDECITKLASHSDAHSLRTVVPSTEIPYKMWTLDVHGMLQPAAEFKGGACESFSMPRQLLPKTFTQNACVDVVRVSTLQQLKSISGSRIVPHFMEANHAIYITHEQDLIQAETLFAQLRRNDPLQLIRSSAAANLLANDFDFRNIVSLSASASIGMLRSKVLDGYTAAADCRVALEVSVDDLAKHTATIADAITRGVLVSCTLRSEADVDATAAAASLVSFVKIGIGSALDWPLLEKVAAHPLAVVVLVAGLERAEIDKVVSFMDHKRRQYALCYGVVDATAEVRQPHLRQISAMCRRYPHVVVGWSSVCESTHSHLVQIAYACGARMLDVTIRDQASILPLLSVWMEAVAIVGPDGSDFRTHPESERHALRAMERGVVAAVPIKTGESIDASKVKFCCSAVDGQMTATHLRAGLVCVGALHPDDGIPNTTPLQPKEANELRDTEALFGYIHAIKGFLREKQVHLGFNFEAEVSHHFGIQNLAKFGCVILSMFNTKHYCRKIILQTKGQYNPFHYHMIKDETFTVVHGRVRLFVEKNEYTLHPGEHLRVAAGLKHAFEALEDSVIEEVSSEAINTDSYYLDPAISKLPRSERKHALPTWALL